MLNNWELNNDPHLDHYGLTSVENPFHPQKMSCIACTVLIHRLLPSRQVAGTIVLLGYSTLQIVFGAGPALTEINRLKDFFLY